MNQQQIKYVKECLAIRKRRLLDEYARTATMPHEIACYEKKVNEWRDKAREAAGIARDKIERKIRSVEEKIILGGNEPGLSELLNELDGWEPTDD